MADLMHNHEDGLSLLLTGKAPGNPELLEATGTGLDSLTDFLARQYLDTYIPSGGSKIKFVTGLQGSGKTFFAETMMMLASKRNYLQVSIDARNVWLNDFRDIYLEILNQCGLENILRDCADQIILSMGRRPEMVPEGKTLMDVLSEQGEGDAFAKGEIRDALRKQFTRNPLLDNTFAVTCSLLVGDILGYPVLENSYREVLMAWMHGEKGIKAAQMKALGLSPVKITRQNARHMLRSLCEIIHFSGRPGLMIVIDNLEQLISKDTPLPIRYTKGKREDTYESIRQLIDDIDSMRYVLFLFCLDRELIDDESTGIKTYQALWFRIQNEVISNRFNRFADIIDMDRYGDEMYDVDMIMEMSRKLADAVDGTGQPIDRLNQENAELLKTRASFGRLGLPYLVNRLTLEGGQEHA